MGADPCAATRTLSPLRAVHPQDPVPGSCPIPHEGAGASAHRLGAGGGGRGAGQELGLGPLHPEGV